MREKGEAGLGSNGSPMTLMPRRASRSVVAGGAYRLGSGRPYQEAPECFIYPRWTSGRGSRCLIKREKDLRGESVSCFLRSSVRLNVSNTHCTRHYTGDMGAGTPTADLE